MLPIRTKYTVTLTDFRQATYYGLVLRYRMPFLFMAGVIGFALLYGILCASGFFAPNMLIFFVAAAYAVWGLMMLANAERGIRAYMNTSESVLGCRFEAEIGKYGVLFLIPERKVKASFPMKKIYCIFEISSEFLVYVNAEQVYLLPKRTLSPEEILTIRAHFRKELGQRFSSRF